MRPRFLAAASTLRLVPGSIRTVTAPVPFLVRPMRYRVTPRIGPPQATLAGGPAPRTRSPRARDARLTRGIPETGAVGGRG